MENNRLNFPCFVKIICFMADKPKFKPDPRLKLMDQVRQVLRYHHYAYRTEQTYCDWIVRYIKYFGSKKHPRDMGGEVARAQYAHRRTNRTRQGKTSSATAGRHDQKRGQACSVADARYSLVDGQIDVWLRIAPYGMHPTSGTRPGL